ncbi:restriction endonuclease subunit S [Kitasatospora sp. NPDC049285]|uniref:restriction endonuclease subunit S n=1 Tax=Kitasatospora sp. NPDC049285 TaxID=3157096 RepID=UPI003448EF5E
MSWPIIPLRRIFRVVNGGTPASDDENWGGDVPWATPVDLGAATSGTWLSMTQRTLTAAGAANGSRIVPKRSILLSTRAPIGYVALTKVPMAFNQGCRALVATRPVEERFFVYQLESMVRQLQARGQGTTFLELSSDALAATRVTVPSVDEQRRISDFLDQETARIDKLVDLRSRQRDAIRARQGVYVEKVLGQCLSGKLTRVKYLLRSRPRYGVLVPAFEDDGVPFIRVNDLLDLPGRAGELAKIPRPLSDQYARTITKPGDVLLSVVGTLGRAAIVPDELSGANIARAVCSLRLLSNVIPNLFVAWIGTSEFERQAVLATGSDSAQPTLGMEDLSNFSVRWPTDPKEQERVASQVEEGRRSHAELLRRTDRQLALLSERRQTLITAAVTGQFDVTTARPTHDRNF